jgi:hypothetical protein
VLLTSVGQAQYAHPPTAPGTASGHWLDRFGDRRRVVDEDLAAQAFVAKLCIVVVKARAPEMPIMPVYCSAMGAQESLS